MSRQRALLPLMKLFRDRHVEATLPRSSGSTRLRIWWMVSTGSCVNSMSNERSGSGGGGDDG